MNIVRAVLIDLSGTLHIDSVAIPGAVDALERLRNSNLIIKFVTNTTKECKQNLYDRLSSLGFNIKLDEIYSSLTAARKYIEEKQLRPMLLIAPSAMQDFEGLALPDPDLHDTEGEQPNAVLIGLAPTELHYSRLNDAFRRLMDGAQLIAVHASRYYKTQNGLSLGPGCFVKGLEYSAKCHAKIIGKPEEMFFRTALGDIKPSEAVMIGDDVTDDIAGAMLVGMKGILVQTGKYQPNDEDKIQPRPTAVVPSFVEAAEKILTEYTNSSTGEERI